LIKQREAKGRRKRRGKRPSSGNANWRRKPWFFKKGKTPTRSKPVTYQWGKKGMKEELEKEVGQYAKRKAGLQMIEQGGPASNDIGDRESM